MFIELLLLFFCLLCGISCINSFKGISKSNLFTPRINHAYSSPCREVFLFDQSNIYYLEDDENSNSMDGLITNNRLMKPLHPMLDNLSSTSSGNTTLFLLNVISIGDEYEKNRPQIKDLDGFDKVFGCLANVWLRSDVVNGRVSIQGESDSRVAKGLMVILIQSIGRETMSIQDVLSLDISETTNHSALNFLPIGRLNGLKNMMLLVQKQVQTRLDEILNPIADKNKQYRLDWVHPYEEEVAMLLSGGVDSSVALNLLKEQGRKVRAFYLKIWLEDEIAHLNECPWEEDLQYASSVCNQLHIPLETISLQKEYWDEVVSYTLQEAKLGRTPNPDIMCNSRIKFGMFYQYVGNHFDYVATGHYAQVSRDETDPSHLTRLITSPDKVKDQTYFLSNLKQSQLSKALFPIGKYEKWQVRELANKYNLPTKERKDSQGICFLGKLKFDDFIAHYLGESPGEIRFVYGNDYQIFIIKHSNRDIETGALMGHHRGLWYHTIGQRKGLGPMLLPKTVHLGPFYVASKDSKSNILYVTNREDVINKSKKRFYIHNFNWIVKEDIPIGLNDGIFMTMKLRHSPFFVNGMVLDIGDNTLLVELIAKEKSIAAGQFAAFYHNNICLGSGVISLENE